MKTLNAALIFRFIDRLSQPARAAARAIGSIEAAQKMGQRASAQWARGLDDLDRKLGRLANASLVTEGLDRAGRAMSRPLIAATRTAIGYNEQLEAIGDTAGLSAAGVGRLDRAVRAASALGGRGPVQIAEAAAIYSAAGFAADVTERLLGTTTKVAVGARVGFEDAANAAVAFGQNLAIAPEQMERAFDAAHRAGQRGRFELKAMASAFPVVGAAAQRRGMTGTAAVAELSAALQMVRRQTSDDGSAATAVRDMLNRFDSNEVQSNFDKFGIDVVAAVRSEQAKGATVIDAILNTVRRAQGKGAQLNQLFTEQDSQNAVAALLQFRTEFTAIREDASAAAGVVETSFNRMRATDAEKLQAYTAGMERLAISTGVMLAPAVGWAATMVERLSGWMSRAQESGNPLARAAVIVAAGLAAGAVAAGAMGNAVIGIIGPWLIMKSVFGTLGGAAVQAGFARIAMGIGIARNAALGFNIALLANPVVLGVAAAVVAIAGIALIVRKYWGPISAFFTGMGQGLAEAFAPIGAALAPLRPVWDAIVGGVRAAWNWLTRLLAPMVATEKQLAGATSAGQTFGRIVGAAVMAVAFPFMAVARVAGMAFGIVRRGFAWSPMGFILTNWGPISGAFVSIFGRVGAFFSGLPARFMAFGASIIDGLVNGIRNGIGRVVGAAAEAGRAAASGAAGALGIRSPSRVFARLGDYTMQGLAVGVQRSRGLPIGRVAAVAAALAGTAASGTIAMAAPTGAPSGGAASAAAPAAQTINQYFTVNGDGVDIRAIARELKRLGDAGARAAMNDGDQR